MFRRLATLDEFSESEHPRGQPGNSGQFSSSVGGGGGPSKKGSVSKSEVASRKSPKTLPEEHSKYFNTTPGTKVVPLGAITPSKSEGVQQEAERAAKYMDAAAKGEISKRDPLTVQAIGNGKFQLIDGNGTLAAAKNYGWNNIPVTVVESGTGKGSLKGKGTSAAPDFRESLARKAEGDDTQPVKSLDELYERAKKADKPFRDTIDALAARYNSQSSYTPSEYAEPGTILKSRKSAERKLKSELGGDPTLLRDVIRATIVSERVEDTRKAAADFIGEQGDSILRVKDRYVDLVGGGYRDILINYRTPEGLVAEVQFNSANMLHAKNGEAHKIYEQMRELSPADATPALVERLNQQMSALYESAYQADGDGNWKKAAMAHDSEGVISQYKLTPPDGNPFEARIVKDSSGTGIVVESTRSGAWAPDDKLHFADLIAPEQALGDWEVTRVEPGEDSFDKGAVIPARDSFQRRAIDRTFDLEYYTAEQLGPNRERTPEGFLICYDVPAARIGEMAYSPREVPAELGVGRDGSVRITRSEAEVFDARSMASLNGKPVTDDHPPVDVDPKNWQFYTKGVVVNPRRGEGDNKDFLVVDLIVYDEDTINDIAAGKREVSCGYNPEYLQLVDSSTGEPIQGRGEQAKIRYNHLALVKSGRCGPHCAIGDQKTVDGVPSAFFSLERERRLVKLLRRIAR